MARIVNFFDGAQSETVPTIGNIVASNLIQYANDAAYQAAEQGAPTTGNIYYNTTLNLIRYYTGTQWISLVDTNSNQTVINKIINADNNSISNIDNDEIKLNAGIDTTKLADGSVSNTEFQYINSLSSNAQTQLDSKIPLSQKGAANGVATLDNNQMLPAAQLPISAMEIKSAWDASTNTPTLVDGTGNAGDVYEVIVAGTQNFGNGPYTFKIGDWVVYGADGKWYKSINVSEVTTVNGQIGAVSLSLGDLNDVTTTGAVADQILKFNGTEWVPGTAAATGANTTLSNLTSPIAINQNITPDTTLTRNLGSSTKKWSEVFTDTIHTSTVDSGNGPTQIFADEIRLQGVTPGFSPPIKLYDNDNSNYIALKAPSSVGANATFILPPADGNSGQFLKTDGVGNLSFGSPVTPTTLSVDTGGLITYPVAVNTFGDLLSLSLSAGTWDIYLVAEWYVAGAGNSTGTVVIGASLTPGNSSAGLSDGTSALSLTKRNGVDSYDNQTLMIPNNVYSTTTTVYFKVLAGTNTTQLKIAARLFARKINY